MILNNYLNEPSYLIPCLLHNGTHLSEPLGPACIHNSEFSRSLIQASYTYMYNFYNEIKANILSSV